MDFSRARLRGHREGRRLDQAALGERVGLEPWEVAEIEAGLREPDELLTRDLAIALSVPDSQLHRIDATYSEDYADVVASYAAPLPEDAVARLARIIHGHRLAAS